MKSGRKSAKAAVSVLLVEDDPAGLAMLALALRGYGFSVVGCSCPAAALEKLVAERFSWLVTDARLSSGDGFSLSEAATDIQPDLRVVMISAVACDQDIQGRPIERVFSKPVALDALVAWLKSPKGGLAQPA
ncbi:MAG: response regulator [Elusimicrobia bacterium]|nr:response regulator [Elusimicrobiota bacterium]